MSTAADTLDVPHSHQDCCACKWVLKLTGKAYVQTAIGHWGETMFPLFSILKREASFAWPPSQFVLLHLKRVRASSTSLLIAACH